MFQAADVPPTNENNASNNQANPNPSSSNEEVGAGGDDGGLQILPGSVQTLTDAGGDKDRKEGGNDASHG